MTMWKEPRPETPRRCLHPDLRVTEPSPGLKVGHRKAKRFAFGPCSYDANILFLMFDLTQICIVYWVVSVSPDIGDMYQKCPLKDRTFITN